MHLLVHVLVLYSLYHEPSTAYLNPRLIQGCDALTGDQGVGITHAHHHLHNMPYM
jgi:hypothetical protein